MDVPTTEEPLPISCSNQACIAATSIAAVLCSLTFFFVGAISGGLGVLWITIRRQKRVIENDHQLPSDPVYEDPLESAMQTMKTTILSSLTDHEASEFHVEWKQMLPMDMYLIR